MFIRGIDVRTSSGTPVDVSRLVWSVNYSGTGTGLVDASGSTTCGLIGLNSSSTTEALDCETDLVAFVSNSANGAISDQQENGGPYYGWGYSSGGEPAPAGAVGGFIALKTVDLDFATNSNVHTFGGGCFDQDWVVGSPTYLDYQRYFELTEDTSAPWAPFNVDLWCYTGFVP